MIKLRFSRLFVIGAVLILSGCTSKNNESVLDVQGTWRGQVNVTACDPAEACSDAGFVQGSTLSAVLVLTQQRSELTGTYGYEGLPVSAPVSGRVGANVIALNGAVTVPLGSITVSLSGTVSGSTMNVAVTHQVTLTDGRAANVTAGGTLTR